MSMRSGRARANTTTPVAAKTSSASSSDTAGLSSDRGQMRLATRAGLTTRTVPSNSRSPKGRTVTLATRRRPCRPTSSKARLRVASNGNRTSPWASAYTPIRLSPTLPAETVFMRSSPPLRRRLGGAGTPTELPRQDSNLRPVDTKRARPRARAQKNKGLASRKSRGNVRNAPEAHLPNRPQPYRAKRSETSEQHRSPPDGVQFSLAAYRRFTPSRGVHRQHDPRAPPRRRPALHRVSHDTAYTAGGSQVVPVLGTTGCTSTPARYQAVSGGAKYCSASGS